MHTIVVGGGIWGLSTAWALIRAGESVTLIDRGPLPNPVNASYDEHRLIRLVYAEASGYAALIPEAFALWGQLWQDLGRSHYVETGTLAISAEAGDWTDRALGNLRALGLDHAVWSPEALARNLAHMTPTYPFRYALFQPQGGILKADRIAEDLVVWLENQGVELRPNARVVELEEDRPGVVLASGERVMADALVLCCGAWTGELAPEFSGAAEPHRQGVVYLEPPSDLRAAWEKSPIMVDMGSPADLWGAPPVDGTRLKIGVGTARRPARSWLDLTARPADTQSRLDAWRNALPGLDRYQVLETKICFYGKGQDDRFIARRVAPRSWALGNDAGHGYKFGPWIGRETARMLRGDMDTQLYRNRLAGLIA